MSVFGHLDKGMDKIRSAYPRQGWLLSLKDPNSVDVELRISDCKRMCMCVHLLLIFNRCTAAFQFNSGEVGLWISPNIAVCIDLRCSNTIIVPAIENLLNQKEERSPLLCEKSASAQGSGLIFDSCEKGSDYWTPWKWLIIEGVRGRHWFEDNSICLCPLESIRT